jgi:hypothetical protein
VFSYGKAYPNLGLAQPLLVAQFANLEMAASLIVNAGRPCSPTYAERFGMTPAEDGVLAHALPKPSYAGIKRGASRDKLDSFAPAKGDAGEQKPISEPHRPLERSCAKNHRRSNA